MYILLAKDPCNLLDTRLIYITCSVLALRYPSGRILPDAQDTLIPPEQNRPNLSLIPYIDKQTCETFSSPSSV
jgi:hypothetical protein